MSKSPALSVTPLQEPRHASLDLMRGFAVMGILLVNIVSFALPSGAAINPLAWGGDGLADKLAWFLAFILFDGKMRGLFALLFGASMLLMMERVALAGNDPLSAHRRRMSWLLLFGLLHFMLWWGEILVLYALVGLFVVHFASREALSQVKLAFLAFGVQFLILIATVAYAAMLQSAALLPDATQEAISAYRAYLAQLGDPSATASLAADIALHRSGLAPILSYNLAQFPFLLLSQLLYFGLEAMGFMLLGMAMLKSGFLTGGWQVEQYRATARHCFLIGLPPMILMAAWLWYSGFPALGSFATFFAWSFPFRIPLTVGYAALILWIATPRFTAPLARAVAAVGRTALTNYLGTTIIMTGIFYGYGLGLYGSVARAPLYLFVLPAWALMLIWSTAWLARFRYGPLEWLWRSLSVGKFQPLRTHRS